MVRKWSTGPISLSYTTLNPRFSLPVAPAGDLEYRGRRGAVGVGYSFTVCKRTLPPAPSRGWFGFIVNSKGKILKAKVPTGFIKSLTKL
jgi:hypothetical protein